ncbi:sensor histidine kinase [Longimicrobium sp.]|uniref:sensor histidine kinase n=1 Tax=Longimicrobium sp. TaxID=2029185 RepID=UPI002EDB9824
MRGELLFNLTFLGLAAALLAAATRTVMQAAAPGSAWLLVLLVLADAAAFVLLANHLIVRLVLRPVQAAVAAAEAVAGGDYERRAPAAESHEMAALSQALNRMTDQLLDNQQRLADNVRSLDETNRRLLGTERELVEAEKMAGVGRLAAGVAHEIGNPLAALMGYAAVLRRRGADPELVGGLEGEARRIDRIVRGLLEYARPAPREREPVDANESIRRAVHTLRSQGLLDGIDVVLHLADGLPPLSGSPHLLDQVWVNLLDNARRAMEARGTLTVTTALEQYRPERPLPTRRADDPPGISYAHLRRPRAASIRDPHRIDSDTETLRVSVEDTGPGISPEAADKVFDPFFTTRPPGEGTGLGLAIVASTVADFGGRVEVAAAPGGGAAFVLFLPTRRHQS